MEIDATLSILAAAFGGFLLGWQLRADFTAWRARRAARLGGAA